MNCNFYSFSASIFFVGLTVCTTACNDSVVTDFEEKVTAEVSGTIGLSTRAYNNVWESGDKIGIFVFEGGSTTAYKQYSNYAYETTGSLGTFSPVSGNDPIYMPATGVKLDFLAYWPYQASLADNNTFSITSWADQSNQKKLDLLLSDKVIDRTMAEKSVALNFKHQFSKLILNIKANTEESQLLSSDLVGMNVKAAGMNVSTSVNVLTGVLTNGSAVTDAIVLATDETSTAADVQATAIIAPGYNTTTTIRKVTFSLTNGKTYTWTIPSGKEFLAGNSYTWTIKLKGEGLVEAELTATIEDWTNNDEGEINLDMD